MKRIRSANTSRRKAALAALAFLSLSPLSALSRPADVIPSPGLTIPALPDEEEALCVIRRAIHFGEAEAPLLMKDFLNLYPGSVHRAEVSLLLADYYFFQKEYPLALKYYSMLRDDSFSGDVRERMFYRKAYSQIKTGYYREASVYLKKLRNSRQYGEDARFYVAYIDYVNGKYDEAYTQFQKIQAAGPKGAEAEYYINQIDFKRKDYKKVATTSERLLSPGDKVPEELKPETMRVGGLSFFKIGDKTTARHLLSQYVEQKGDGADITALYSLGTIYYDEGDFDKALPLFQTVTEYPGALAQSSWLYIGQIYLSQDDPGAAALAFDKAAKESWDNDIAETAAYNLAVTSAEGNTIPFSDAAAAMESFIEAYPSSPYSSSLSNYLANAYYSRRNYEEALRQIDKISNPDSSTKAMRQKTLYQLGVSRLQQGKIQEAIANLSEAASSGYPDKEVASQASLWLGDAYYAEKDYSQAAKAYKTAISDGWLGDNKDLAYYNLGYSYLKLKNYKDAETAFKTASEGKGLGMAQKTDALLRYGDCLYYNGKYKDALAVFRKIKSSGGDEGVLAAVREADILGREGKTSEKIAVLEGLYNGKTAGMWRSTVVSRLADAYSENGDDKKAAGLYDERLDSAGAGADNTEIFYSLAVNADNLYNSGDKASALEIYKRVETSGIDALYPLAITGIMRSSSDNKEIITYAAKVASLPGISADEADEARLLGAEAALASGTGKKEAMETLRTLSDSPDRIWGARAAVVLAETLLKEGYPGDAEKVLLALIDNGSDDNYWLARGYITLADAYMAMKKDHLAKLYLQTLQANYPGKEADISNMIKSRLDKLDK